jgi:hypothetical protein
MILEKKGARFIDYPLKKEIRDSPITTETRI